MSSPTTTGAPPPARWTTVAGLLAVAVALVAVWLWVSMLVAPWRLASGLVETADHLTRAEQHLGDGALKKALFETIAAEGASARARKGLESGSPLIEAARSLPAIDTVLAEAGHLVSAAEYSTRAARGSLEIAHSSLRGSNRLVASDPDGGSRFRLEKVAAITDLVTAVTRDLDAARSELAAVDVESLPRRLRNRVNDGLRRAADTRRVLDDVKGGLEILPDVLGANGSRTYLIGMQNSAELRGSGGAMLQFAFLQFDEGRMSLDKSRTVYKLDLERQTIPIALPEDAWYVRAIPDAQRFGNSNWSPDWPLTSRLAIEYGKATERRLPPKTFDFPDPIHGVIGVDPVTMKELMAGVGKYRTPAGHMMNERTVVPFTMYRAYHVYPIPAQRRYNLRQVVDGFYEGLIDPKRPADLARGLGEALGTKHMQIWLTDPHAQDFIEQMNWDGALEPAKDADYFDVVEQNVGGNKLDYFARQVDELEIDIIGSDALHRTRVLVENKVFLPQPSWLLGVYGPIHRPMLNFYVPPSSRLTAARPLGARLQGGAGGALDWVDGRPPEHRERGKKVWSGIVEIDPNTSGGLEMSYRVPDVVRGQGGRRTYRLVIQRQPKVHPETVELTIRLPDGARDIAAPGWRVEGTTLRRTGPLTRDIELEVSWRE